MAVSDLHLAVEVGAWWTTAIYSQNGTAHPLYFDGQARLPSGVYLHPDTGVPLAGTAAFDAGMTAPAGYRSNPMALLHANAPADDGVDPIDAVAAVLAHVANVASGQVGEPIAELTVVTSSAWGPRARQRLQQAANKAGLPDPHVVTVAAAAAKLVFQDGDDQAGRYVLVGSAELDLAVLDCARGYQQLAQATVLDPSAGSVDDRLLEVAAAQAPQVVGEPPSGWLAHYEIRQARATLAVKPRASVLLPEPYPAAALSRADLDAAAAPHLGQLEDRVKQLLAEADLEAADIGSVVLRGGDAVIPDLEAGLARGGLPPAVVLREPHAIVRGALRLTQPQSAAAGGTAETMRLPRTRLTLASLTRIAVLAACSVALLLQTVTSADISKIGGTIVGVLFQVENLGLAAALAALTAWAGAQLAPTTWVLANQADDEITTGTLLRRGFLGAAALGLAIAGLWGLGAGIGVGRTNETYLKVALVATAPIALSAAVVALTAPRIPAPALLAWLRRASPPALPIALATVGVYAQWTVYTTRHLPYLNFAFGLLEIGGAALLGVATALTATRQPLLRIIAAVILGAGYVLVADVSTTGYLTIAYTVLLAWWAITTAIATTMTGSTGISAWLSRLITPPK